jgi:hypothetical protein
MAEVIIGEVAYAVSLPNFKALKAAWAFISAVQDASDPMAGVEAILGLISVGAKPQVSADQLQEQLRPDQMLGLRPFVDQLLTEIGFAAQPGEGAPSTAAANRSTATSTPSSTS